MKDIPFRKPSVVTLLVGVILAAALLVLAGSLTRPAEAAVPGQVRAEGFSAFNSTNLKTAQATCPSGKKVIGTGAEIEGAGGQVTIFGVEPKANSVVATAYEDETGTTANWWIRVYAVCADPLPGLVVVTNASANDSANPKQVTVVCPAGKKLTGTGVFVEFAGPIGQFVLDDVIPSSALDGVQVKAYEDETGTSANWRIRGYSICA
jgi:DNA-binding beta-propeller fold protein YncE